MNKQKLKSILRRYRNPTVYNWLIYKKVHGVHLLSNLINYMLGLVCVYLNDAQTQIIFIYEKIIVWI